MNGDDVTKLVDNLSQGGLPDAAALATHLGTTFKAGGANPYWTTYNFNLNNSPFARGDFRLSKDGQKALLNLETGNDSALVADDLDLTAWGPVVGISPNPRIPPEGADAEVVHQVALAVVRDGDDAIGPRERPPDHDARIEQRRAVGQELRIENVDDVVDRHDGAGARQRRDHVVGGVEEIEAVAPQAPGEARQLGDRIAR